jgi:transcriptional regulator with GAF, ATPase, and Fis domain
VAVIRSERLAQTFVDLADTLVDEFDVVDLYALLADRCVELFDASQAGLLLADDAGTLRLVAATHEATELVELFQLQNDEGPCLDCFRSGQQVLIADLERADTVWPRFAPVAREAGFRSVNAFPLRLRDRVLGALNLFDAEVRRLDQADVVAAQAMADIATIGLLQYRTITDAQALARHLSAALESRIAIEQAKGIMAERLGLGTDEAFERLRRYARSRGRRLSEVAEEVVAGTLPPASLGG